MSRPRLIALSLPLLAAAALGVGACGTKDVSLAKTDPNYAGAELFAEHCSGCHTLGVAGTQGSATNVRTRERKDGPNFDQRKEQTPDVLYAIQNGGFSSGPMPQDILTGRDAQLVANFVSKYSGSLAKRPPSPVTNQGGGAPAGSQ
jgi:mono/diheme cytochrome c family protein